MGTILPTMFDNASSIVTSVINFLLLSTVICAIVRGAGPDERPENVTVYFKSWPFRLIDKECRSNFLYDYGYTSIMVSPVQAKKQSENFRFNDLFKFQTPLGTMEEFAGMIKSCDKKGIKNAKFNERRNWRRVKFTAEFKVYVSVKLITDKQIRRVIRRYEEIEPFLLQRRREKRARLVAEIRSKVQSNEQTKWDYAAATSEPEPRPVAAEPRAKSNERRFDANFMKKRQHKNTKYLMELALLSASNIDGERASSLIRSFKAVNKRYRVARKKSKILSEKSGVPRLLRKYCKLKYKMEDISAAVRFIQFLMHLGVSGIRIENSRYAASWALAHIVDLAQKDTDKKLTLIFDNVSNVRTYQRYGSIMDEEYARKLMKAVKNVNFKQLVTKKKIWPEGWNVPKSEKSRPYIVEYMIPGDKNSKVDSYNFKIATSLMLINPYGSPIIVSPFNRLKKRISDLANVEDMKIEDICDNGKFCIHRKKFIRQLVLSRLITKDNKITSTKVLDKNVMYVNRGNLGFAAFIHRMDPPNDTTENKRIILQTELPTGVYCNIITGYEDLKRGECAPGSAFQIDMEKRIVIEKDEGFYKGVLAFDILSHFEYMDIEANGELHFKTAPTKGSDAPIQIRSIDDPPVTLLAISENTDDILLQPREVGEPKKESTSWTSYLYALNPLASTSNLRSDKVTVKFDFWKILKLPLLWIGHFFKWLEGVYNRVMNGKHPHWEYDVRH